MVQGVIAVVPGVYTDLRGGESVLLRECSLLLVTSTYLIDHITVITADLTSL